LVTYKTAKEEKREARSTRKAQIPHKKTKQDKKKLKRNWRSRHTTRQRRRPSTGPPTCAGSWTSSAARSSGWRRRFGIAIN
jgi:hypothetical protein